MFHGFVLTARDGMRDFEQYLDASPGMIAFTEDFGVGSKEAYRSIRDALGSLDMRADSWTEQELADADELVERVYGNPLWTVSGKDPRGLWSTVKQARRSMPPCTDVRTRMRADPANE